MVEQKGMRKKSTHSPGKMSETKIPSPVAKIQGYTALSPNKAYREITIQQF
jgi:hypothetical protein